MPPLPDIVQISRLDTQFLSNQEYTKHIQYISGNTLAQRRVAKKETWRRDRKLGHGTFGEVWLEQCIQGDKNGEARAVKRIQKHDRNNCYRELEAIALFSHSKYEHCFVKSSGWYDDKDSIYIAMEFLPYGDLQNQLVLPLPESECQSIVLQVLEGLNFMHQNGFAHRDLKPANILVVSKGPEWWVKIADFGISKRAVEEQTVLRTQAGTLAFAAPEVLGFTQSDSYTNAVDIWSLGVITFLLLTGETLFKDQRRLGQYATGVFKFPSHILLANEVSTLGCDFVMALMALRSEDRPGAEEGLHNPWLTCPVNPVASNTQRITNASKSFETNSDCSNAEASASWSITEPFSNVSHGFKVGLIEFLEPTRAKSSTEPIKQLYMNTPAVLEGHGGEILGMDISPDGKLIASASGDKTIMLWDLASGMARATLIGHTNTVERVVFSPDGKLVASGSRDKTVRVWDPASGAARATLEGHTDMVTGVAFSPDGKLVASASFDKTIKLWDMASGTVRATLEGHIGLVMGVAFSPCGNLLASADENTVRLWHLASGMVYKTLSGHTGTVSSIAFSPDGRLIASASWDTTIRLWDTAFGAVRVTLKGPKICVTEVAFSPDGKLVASAGVDQRVRLWDLASGAAHADLEGHISEVVGLAFLPGGKLVASMSSDASIRLWDSGIVNV